MLTERSEWRHLAPSSLGASRAGLSKVLGSGTRSGDTLVLSFPYPGATFRDTFSLDRKNGTWTLLIESRPDGKPWSTFASYTATRGKP